MAAVSGGVHIESSYKNDNECLVFRKTEVQDYRLEVSIPRNRCAKHFVSKIYFSFPQMTRDVSIDNTLYASQSFFWASIHALCQKILSIFCLRFGDRSGILDLSYYDNHFYLVVKNLEDLLPPKIDLPSYVSIVHGRWLTQIKADAPAG